MSHPLRFVVYLAFLSVLLASLSQTSLKDTSSRYALNSGNFFSAKVAASSPSYHESFITFFPEKRFIHSPTLAQVDPERLLAVWFAGTKERGRDVVLEGADLDLASGKWSGPRVLVSHETLERDLGRVIKTIGNPALLSDRKGRVYLFFVSTSLGGWSTSQVNWIESRDSGTTWSRAKRLVLSPFFNLSTLVRNKGFFYENGSLGLPAYHELASKYGLVLKMDEKGHLIKMDRIPAKNSKTFQPSIAPLNPTEAVALMRDASPERSLRLSRTSDGGKNWTTAEPSRLPNPNKSVSVESSGEMLFLVLNDSQKTRNSLSLAVSRDRGQNWERKQLFENDPEHPKANYSYPEIVIDTQGDAHVVYSYLYQGIKHVRFNKAWLDGKRLEEVS